MGQAALSSGSIASIRGFGTFALNPGVDQSVSLVVDGLPMTHGLAYQSGYFDLAQVEVLKGPSPCSSVSQSLFFGKSAPAGVISLLTADPGSKLEVIARGLYEVEARERRGELIVSTPSGVTAGVSAWRARCGIPMASTRTWAPPTTPRHFWLDLIHCS
jgi:outer membrane receptor protein involved in Fe transport